MKEYGLLLSAIGSFAVIALVTWAFANQPIPTSLAAIASGSPIRHYVAAGYLAAINLTAFIAFGLDKRRAERGKWRISEATLLGLCALGGSVGGMAGVRVFHHKTLQLRFTLGIALMLAAHLCLLVYLLAIGIA